ncbi:MAG: autotransporter-associated beta strand repeat-containing protein [Bacteroidales bacterium]|nr:autotransporter-associated beta strand repeat-containing protein [Bacteroidales bacterium]
MRFLRNGILLLLLLTGTANKMDAQRAVDKLDRGLVATIAQNGVGNFISWRILGEEHYDVTYNLYANNLKIASNLTTSNYVHSTGTVATSYQVSPVVRGVEGEKCTASTRWSGTDTYSYTGFTTGYLDLPGQTATDRAGIDATSDYEFNDVVAADVNGDGQLELICKRNYTGDRYLTSNTTRFNRIEVLTLSGVRLWWIDLGPNMQAGPDEQWDAIAFDWDMDGKAEVMLRGADNMIIHKADGTTVTIGDNPTYDSRTVSNTQYTSVGNEYLLYLNGTTGEPYPIGDNDKGWMTYPLKRYETGESSLAVWGKDGDGGHRASKHYFGAPYLDGQKPSIFLGRGAYTRHKFTAYDVDPATHKLTRRWYWSNNIGGSPWFGQGYHNFAIQDVDMDGRDEIMFGSMTIDDNGKGLSTTGLGHGDAQHCGDLDPYRWGLEQFTCNENAPNMNFRNATTSELYYRSQGTSDDGRALMANFSNSYPGSQGRSVNTGFISSVADKAISELDANGFIAWGDLNFRIFWDGDLLSEVLNSPGTAKSPKIDKPGVGRIFLSNAGNMNNSSKNNPGMSGDILGDWREEIVIRNGTGLRIYTSNYTTPYRIPTLWHDHGYRQAMVWQTIGYNQPPHPSYFLGELEGITETPPALIATDRQHVTNGGAIGSAHTDQQVLVYENQNSSIAVEDGIRPWNVIVNVPSWTQGQNGSETSTKTAPVTQYYTSTLTGGAFAGSMRLIKQGEGELILPTVEQLFTGNTDVWNGTLTFHGKLLGSSLWLNRHTTLNSNGGQFRSIQADYNATIRPGGKTGLGTITTDTLQLGFGARIQFDLTDVNMTDKINAKVLSLETKSWQYGPKYLAPVFEFVMDEPGIGTYDLGVVDSLVGLLSDVIIEGIGTRFKSSLSHSNDHLYLTIANIREATSIRWNGNESAVWDFAQSKNFTLASDTAVNTAFFVTGDKVLFDATASNKSITLKGNLEADSIIVDGTESYRFDGTGSIIGASKLIKRGDGTLTVSTDNAYTGGTRISGGTVAVTSLSHANLALGQLGAVSSVGTNFIVENGATLQTSGTVTQGSAMQMVGEKGGILNNAGDFIVNRAISGSVLTKKGSGWMKLNVNNNLDRLIIADGTVQCIASSLPGKIVEFQNGALLENTSSSYTIHVPKDKSGTQTLVNNASFSNKITGEGALTIRCTVISGSGWFATRTRIKGDWSQFEGTIHAVGSYGSKDTEPRFTLDASTGLPKGTLNIADNTTVQNTGKSFTIGTVSGGGKLGGWASFANDGASGTNTWRLGNDSNWSWAGTVTANSNFVKIGSGKVSLTGTHNHTGYTTVEAGELLISGSTIKLGTGALTVRNGAMLSGVTGTGSLSNSFYTFDAGATLQVGTSPTSTIGNIDFGGKDVTMSKDAFIDMGILTSNVYTSLQNIKKLTMNGTIRLHWNNWIPALGDSIQLFQQVQTFAGTPLLENLVIDSDKGLYWDTTELASKGFLRVASINGLNKPNDSTIKPYVMDRKIVVPGVSDLRLYTVQGLPVDPASRLSAGTYIVIANGFTVKMNVE